MDKIKEFYIKGLYGEKDVNIPFESNYKILVAENGCGKTTILNSFYALLSGDISKLRKIKFDEIGIKFSDGKDINFKRSDFEISSEALKENPLYSVLSERIGHEILIDLINESKNYPISVIEKLPIFHEAAANSDLPEEILKDFIRQSKIRDRKNPNSKIGIISNTQAKLVNIKKKINLVSLYLPTYRRVEEDIRAFSVFNKNSRFSHSSINFGMSDVEQSIKRITNEIRESSVEWFSKINGQMLSQLVDGFIVTDEMKASILRPKAVEIVLGRVGKNINESEKQKILYLVESKELLKGHDPLLYFVSNLLKVYEQQQENDQAIQDFISVCNKYLVDKEFSYDESNVKIDLFRKKNNNYVNIESLSSGEKQIISLFAILYLQKKDDLAIFFDEPELSLSIEWQKTLLPDIIDSKKCKFLFSTTHSPFIFDNILEKDTVDLSSYIKEL